MLWALGAVGPALEALQSLTSAKSQPQTAAGANPFEPQTPSTTSAGSTSGFAPASPGGGSISPDTMNALLAAQGQSATGSTGASSRTDSLKDLFSQIDADHDGKITKSEFEKALGAGGSNVAQADHVFSRLDANGDGNVDVGEMGKALLGSHRGHHHAGRPGASATGGTDSANGQGGNSADALMAALDNASSSTVTNSDGSTTTTYGDGRTVTSSAQSNALRHAVSTYSSFEQLMRQNSTARAPSSSGSALLV